MSCGSPSGHIIGQMTRPCRRDPIVDGDRGSIVDRPTADPPSRGQDPLPQRSPRAYRACQPGGAIDTGPERLVRQSFGIRAKVHPGPFVSLGLLEAEPAGRAAAERAVPAELAHGCGMVRREAGRGAGALPGGRPHGHHPLSLVRGRRRAPAHGPHPEPVFTCPGCATSVALVDDVEEPLELAA